ncbi:nucleotidyltransferase family protein [Gemella haemolysans]|uniref:tRNA(Met) cytidine acetate ligase n=1 Tax=Gemella haemolysans TaxID=1379 RepID=UPI0023789D11|nr:nucleotidyltransferase family protein [Gemella haemolysans]
MRIGIVAEFNPLHSGHRYLIECARKLADENHGEVICVMSEFFTQRGEVAIVDGYIRAKEAVRSGCDMVIALPYFGSVAYGDDFARKSIEILAGTGITHLIFGTEKDDVSVFEEIYTKQQKINEEEYKKLLKTGLNHAKINSVLYGLESNNPNFSLAYSYYKAIREAGLDIKMVPIRREGQGLNSSNISGEVHLSATTIRNNINDEKIEKYLSKEMVADLRKETIASEVALFPYLKYKILSLGKAGIEQIYDVNEGLENRIYEATLKAKTYSNLVELIATKRYSNKKIQRVLLHILTNTTKEDYKENFSTNNFRVLAVKKHKAAIIRDINRYGEISLHPLLNSKNSMKFEQDIKVARIYEMLFSNKDVFRENIQIID